MPRARRRPGAPDRQRRPGDVQGEGVRRAGGDRVLRQIAPDRGARDRADDPALDSLSRDLSVRPARQRSTRLGRKPLVSPPVALTLHVFARILAETGRTEDEDLEALRPALVA